MPQETVLFKESQYFSPAFYVIFLACLATVYTMSMIVPGLDNSLLPTQIAFTVAMALTFNLMYMRTTIEENNITVVFGLLFPMYIKRIPAITVIESEAVRYEPLQDYGGWGIRGWGKRRALNARGDFGVLLTLDDGTMLMLGSQVPQELDDAIQNARRHPHIGTRAR